MSSYHKDKTHIIPVVFEITTGDVMTTELDAARALTMMLPRPGTTQPRLDGITYLLESWHTQNHPAADGSDHEAAIVFFPVMPPPSGHSSEDMQRAIDNFLDTTGRWLAPRKAW